jgi:hypothetical protein
MNEAAPIHIEEMPEVLLVGMKELVDHPMREVMKIVKEKYGEEYDIPGPEYLRNLNPNKVPEALKNPDLTYYLMGSEIYGNNDLQSIPCFAWIPNNIHQFPVAFLKDPWQEDSVVVLIKKKSK